jgi:hypothetical protein
MNKWAEWVDIDQAQLNQGPFNHYGIYQIGIVDSKGAAIWVNRLAGVDKLGIIYIGRSGYKQQNSNRTIANRIREFVRQQHSGGKTYAKAKELTLDRTLQFSGHRLRVRASFLRDAEIDGAEADALLEYFKLYAELPPCNSALPTNAKQDSA